MAENNKQRLKGNKSLHGRTCNFAFNKGYQFKRKKKLYTHLSLNYTEASIK